MKNLKTILVSIIFLSIFMSCETTTKTVGYNTYEWGKDFKFGLGSEESIQVAMNFDKAWMGRDFETMTELASDTIKFYFGNGVERNLDYVISGANIFFKDGNGELHTPIPDCFLDGITRRTVIQIAKSKNIKVHERKIRPDELKNFVGCFLTGTAAEVTPVSCIAEHKFKVCKMIIDLNESYLELVKKKKAA